MKTQKRRFLMDLVYRALSFYALTFCFGAVRKKYPVIPIHIYSQKLKKLS
jgi:hypothetical protein